MAATLLDGKALGAKVREEVAASVAELGHVGLATILVGDDPASHVYIDLKHKAATAAGMEARDIKLPADTSEEDVLATIAALNADDAIDGILVQLPLPGAPRREPDHRGDRAGEGRRRDPPDQRGPPLPRPADARAGHAARDHADARRVRDPARRRARRRDRPLGDRRQADGASPPPAQRDRDRLPLAHARPRARHARRPTSSSPRSAVRTSSRPTWSRTARPSSTSG